MSKAALAPPALLAYLLFAALWAEDKPAASPTSPKIGTVQRRVLIFDFENQTGKIEFDYLSGSISDALVDAVRKTGKFRLMLREDARVNAFTEKTNTATVSTSADSMPASSEQKPAENSSTEKPMATPTAPSAATMSVAVNRNDAIKRGREAGADVVVLGKFSELNGVLLFSAQAYESDTRLLKVSEEVLTKSDSDMFNGINVLANKIAESMARELPMFDMAEAERRKTEAARSKIDERDWELQLLSGVPLLHPLYSSDGTITYSKGVPVQKLGGYSLGATFWDSKQARKIGFLPKDSRFGFQGKLSLLTGQADIIGVNSLVLTQSAKLNGVFASSHLLFGFPYWQWNRFMAFAEVGGGVAYTRLKTTDTTIFSSWQPSAVLGTSAAYYFSYWSLGISYQAQVTWFAQNQAFMQHDFWLYAGVRL